jgi:hypothetical protein
MNSNSLELDAVAGNSLNLVPGTTVTVQGGKNLNFSGGNGGITNLGSLTSISNCASSASPAVCGSAMAGRFVIAAGATSVTVNTTAVTANSEIFINEDQSLGTALAVTCNTGFSSTPAVSARVAGTSFTVTISASLATNPVCYSYILVN